MTKPNSRFKAVSFLSNLNHLVFWPPFLLLLAAVILNLTSKEKFSSVTNGARDWILMNFGWLFTLCAFAAVVLCLVISFSRFSEVKLGGAKAQPLMSRWNWFSITICTTIAAGILFWATAEPIFHYHSPPPIDGITAKSPAAATLAMAIMYLHWTFTPYAIYAVVSLTFAFAYYNMKEPYSLGSTVSPILGSRMAKRAGWLVDGVCLYALVAGMAAALGAGIMAIGGGLNFLTGLPSSKWTWAAIAAIIVISFIVSSASGLMKGIRILSDINVKALIGLAVLGFLCGPTVFLLNLGLEAFGVYLSDFFQLNLFNGVVTQTEAVEQAQSKGESATYWSHGWTVFYWAVWIAWAPISGCFLGRIAYGRTVKEFMLINFLLPSLFGVGWMAVFAGTALHMEVNGADLISVAQATGDNAGVEFVTYKVFETFPAATLVIGFYVLSLFICFVTSADSNTTAMAAISSTGISPDEPEGNVVIKIVWGVTVGLVAWIMISFANVDGIKIISTLGGFPAAVLLVFVLISLGRILVKHEQLNVVDQTSSTDDL